jgi:hypothetical protein
MNRCRLKDLLDAWRFLFFHVCHPYGGDQQIELFDRWAANEASLFSGSRWLSRGVDYWRIRLKTGQQLQIHLSDEIDNSGQLRSLPIDLWRLIRECEIAENGEPGQYSPKRRHFAKAYSELQLQVEFLSICLKDDLPEEVQRWLRFIRWKHGPPFKQRWEDPVLSADSMQIDCGLVGPARQPLELHQFGVKSVEIHSLRDILSRKADQKALVSLITTVAERVLKKHKIYRQRFKDQQRVLHDEEEQQELSPLVSSDSDEELETVNPYEELFERNESEDWYVPRYLPSQFGGIRLLRKRWLSVTEQSVFFRPDTFANRTHKLAQERKYRFLRDKLSHVPEEDPSGNTIAFPPIRTVDFEEWYANDDYSVSGYIFTDTVHNPIPRPPWESSRTQDEMKRSVHKALLVSPFRSPPAASQSHKEIVPEDLSSPALEMVQISPVDRSTLRSYGDFLNIERTRMENRSSEMIVPADCTVSVPSISEVSAVTTTPGVFIASRNAPIHLESPNDSVSCHPSESLMADSE